MSIYKEADLKLTGTSKPPKVENPVEAAKNLIPKTEAVKTPSQLGQTGSTKPPVPATKPPVTTPTTPVTPSQQTPAKAPQIAGREYDSERSNAWDKDGNPYYDPKYDRRKQQYAGVQHKIYNTKDNPRFKHTIDTAMEQVKYSVSIASNPNVSPQDRMKARQMADRLMKYHVRPFIKGKAMLDSTFFANTMHSLTFGAFDSDEKQRQRDRARAAWAMQNAYTAWDANYAQAQPATYTTALKAFQGVANQTDRGLNRAALTGDVAGVALQAYATAGIGSAFTAASAAVKGAKATALAAKIVAKVPGLQKTVNAAKMVAAPIAQKALGAGKAYANTYKYSKPISSGMEYAQKTYGVDDDGSLNTTGQILGVLKPIADVAPRFAAITTLAPNMPAFKNPILNNVLNNPVARYATGATAFDAVNQTFNYVTGQPVDFTPSVIYDAKAGLDMVHDGVKAAIPTYGKFHDNLEKSEQAAQLRQTNPEAYNAYGEHQLAQAIGNSTGTVATKKYYDWGMKNIGAVHAGYWQSKEFGNLSSKQQTELLTAYAEQTAIRAAKNNPLQATKAAWGATKNIYNGDGTVTTESAVTTESIKFLSKHDPEFRKTVNSVLPTMLVTTANSGGKADPAQLKTLQTYVDAGDPDEIIATFKNTYANATPETMSNTFNMMAGFKGANKGEPLSKNMLALSDTLLTSYLGRAKEDPKIGQQFMADIAGQIAEGKDISLSVEAMKKLGFSDSHYNQVLDIAMTEGSLSKIDNKSFFATMTILADKTSKGNMTDKEKELAKLMSGRIQTSVWNRVKEDFTLIPQALGLWLRHKGYKDIAGYVEDPIIFTSGLALLLFGGGALLGGAFGGSDDDGQQSPNTTQGRAVSNAIFGQKDPYS